MIERRSGARLSAAPLLRYIRRRKPARGRRAHLKLRLIKDGRRFEAMRFGALEPVADRLRAPTASA